MNEMKVRRRVFALKLAAVGLDIFAAIWLCMYTFAFFSENGTGTDGKSCRDLCRRICKRARHSRNSGCHSHCLLCRYIGGGVGVRLCLSGKEVFALGREKLSPQIFGVSHRRGCAAFGGGRRLAGVRVFAGKRLPATHAPFAGCGDSGVCGSRCGRDNSGRCPEKGST